MSNSDLLVISILGGLLFLVVVALIASLTRSKPLPSAELPYEREEYLFSKAERYFYFALCKAVPPGVHIFAKVRLIDLVRVRRGVENTNKYKNSLLQKHVDFILCAPDTFRPLLVVELDDSSHQSARSQERDARKDEILAAAGLPILRVVAKNAYDQQELTRTVHSKLKLTDIRLPAGRT